MLNSRSDLNAVVFCTRTIFARDIRNFNDNFVDSIWSCITFKRREAFPSESLFEIYKRASLLLMHPAGDDFFIRERRHAILHFCSKARSTRAVYANYLLQTHSSLFSLLDGHAISFNSPTKFVEKSRPTSERAATGRTRTAGIRRYIFTPPCDCISSKFSVCRFARRGTGSAKNNQPYPAPTVVRIYLTSGREINAHPKSRKFYRGISIGHELALSASPASSNLSAFH